jgi:hypothetical protein
MGKLKYWTVGDVCIQVGFLPTMANLQALRLWHLDWLWSLCSGKTKWSTGLGPSAIGDFLGRPWHRGGGAMPL